jgi:hypothetical protein
MTKEQFDTIRARVAWLTESNAYRPPELHALGLPLADARALLDEVERLRADPLPAAAWVREVEQAAFRRGAGAMREAVMVYAKRSCDYCSTAAKIRAQPIPEDKS